MSCATKSQWKHGKQEKRKGPNSPNHSMLKWKILNLSYQWALTGLYSYHMFHYHPTRTPIEKPVKNHQGKKKKKKKMLNSVNKAETTKNYPNFFHFPFHRFQTTASSVITSYTPTSVLCRRAPTLLGFLWRFSSSNIQKSLSSHEEPHGTSNSGP